MDVRSIKLDVVEGKITGISLNAQLDSIYKRLFQNARRASRRNPADVEHGIKVIIFGCFWLESRCNQQFRNILELESKISEFGTSIWTKLKRSNFFDKLEIISTLASKAQKDKYLNYMPRLRSVFDLRNRLAHFKDEDKLLAESSSLEEAIKLISTLPVPDINQELMWSKIKEYAETISETNGWLNSVYRTYCSRNRIRISREALS
ncbi:hypothetical protein ES702_05864 [subsurface metagenome]